MAAVLAGMALLLPGIALTEACAPLPPYWSEHDRIGFNAVNDAKGSGGAKSINDYNAQQLRGGWYLDYTTGVNTGPTQQLGFLRLFRLNDFKTVASAMDRQTYLERFLLPVVLAHPGEAWAVGNEPDRQLQDDMPPQQFAQLYKEVYDFIKLHDPTATVAIGAVVQPTPNRLQYLDEVIDALGGNLVTDAFTIHSFILRETDTWGAGPAVGVTPTPGVTDPIAYDFIDHADTTIFMQRIRAFRVWMKQNGFQDKPLIVSEYGILFGPDFCIDNCDDGDTSNDVKYTLDFAGTYMKNTFDFLITARDGLDSSPFYSTNIGLPSDGRRWVQAWAWYSLNDYIYAYPEQQDGFNGSLLDHDDGDFTAQVKIGDNWVPQTLLGPAFIDYTTTTNNALGQQLYTRYSDLDAMKLVVTPSSVVGTPGNPGTIKLQLWLRNRGSVAAPNVTVKFYDGNPAAGGPLIEQITVASVAARCGGIRYPKVNWTPASLPAGTHTIYAVVTASGDAGAPPEFDIANNFAAASLLTFTRTPVPGGTATPTPTLRPGETPKPTNTPGNPFLNTYLPEMQK